MSMFEVGGGATASVVLLKAFEFGIAYFRRSRARHRSDPPSSEMKGAEAKTRSFSPGQMAAVTADRIQAAQMAREELVDRIETNNLLKRIAEGVESLKDTVAEGFRHVEEKVREDLKQTRHGLKDEIQAIRLEQPMICRAPGAPQLPQRGRLPSRPGG